MLLSTDPCNLSIFMNRTKMVDQAISGKDGNGQNEIMDAIFGENYYNDVTLPQIMYASDFSRSSNVFSSVFKSRKNLF